MLRSAYESADDANMLIDYLKTVTGETRFLMCEPDEVRYTTEGELSFIKEHNKSENGLLILAFVDGEYAGNCSFEGKTSSRRAKHRAGIGIALFQKYTGFGLGRLLLEVWRLMIDKAYQGRGYGKEAVSLALDFIKSSPCGLAEYCWLSYEPENEVAKKLYSSLGFNETGDMDGEELIAVLKL